MTNVFDALKERGFLQQTTDEEGLRSLLDSESVTCYVGYDPTAESLHVGNLLSIMALAHMEQAGHRPLAIVGGGTAMVGDPSGRSELRQMMTVEQIDAQAERIRGQVGRYLDLDGGKSLLLNNADWLRPLNYIEFLRDIGKYFSVNRMLTYEAYKRRLETGLSFIELNYQLLQSYDFMVLNRDYNCKLQMGGDDQWGNIVAGVDLTRRVNRQEVYGMTVPLLTTATGEKMGKTAAGAVWLSGEMVAPYDYYQFWINCDDRDVARFLALYTFLPMDEVRRLSALEGAGIRQAKEVLAYEATRLTHGEADAKRAQEAARAAFGGGGRDTDAMPTTQVAAQRLEAGTPVLELFVETGLASSKKEARRLVEQGGAYVNDERIDDHEAVVLAAACRDGVLLLRAGKKKYHRVVVA
ncbi:MAG: tyrosine--tRNA ligase [Armatimonadetes bacterium CG_4_10_14_3_um_filter_66_18]|nr:tyrosine--tRNA ligase [Armatimonadota bacterium]OIO92247.1 MAG: tyrosine--tRNA ligase [Armatimonadetes bacterium CG2_30_66_41]PIU93068.1 MAG: tyrosine--tRNA ligase [Armatimonadetes bacterium CG06_land_8_20_14_3_00_66_21]PIX37935.1 MAG: tyrosine--tRNA ligase [Armatimonadetes bacterium CG_4_8_14_3_um_filter_66_20]PIY50609.1 MAG: tyrosine--tRNA ligase [Armatimonadetes bacterium CG_4_10_14_3_um_filter_66_18]PIZ37460.1 MAG: tyrosine--tRNA ligase [Armatimonadetes bacterium CG_4_10_14_0_8_um_filte